ncbi:MAG: GAF domain-containing protein [Burkholderiales bacterium]|uniref:GAF domain-containing protein n=1 Tax=Roseateles sp. TaxID=1971397 RepID=UPI000F97C9CE|nr:MAG: GAF domain-containing protein [Burkholderiales bacterium]
MREHHLLLHEQVQALGACMTQGRLDMACYLQELARLLRQQVRCTQVSVWNLCGQGAHQQALCLAQDRAESPAAAASDALQVQGHQAYFDRLRHQGFVASADTHTDPQLQAVRQRYLRPGAPRALLDVAFTVNGQTFGILCCEELARPRPWTAEELMLMRSVGSRVALHLKARKASVGKWAGDASAGGSAAELPCSGCLCRCRGCPFAAKEAPDASTA